ncbi:hypothetical protein [Limosilactobacillus reuteri]|uniref:hypothetical protein n=1 Tax=Limosilactobacillus reuteri TaxID=1598 RepID=UPI00160C53E5|nr:hypothetical protein [Limosilactobacillus reuteri]
MPGDVTDKLVEAHKKADGSGDYRSLKSSILEVKYCIPGSGSHKPQISPTV